MKQINTTIDEYLYAPDDTVVEGDIEEGKVYSEEEMNRVIEIKEREEYRVKKFLEMMNQDQKSIVFCATQKHALAVRDLVNQNSKSTNVNYCHRVTADDGDLGEQHLRDFQDNEKIIPTVLTTSQKLSTGVDAPELKNIILMRTVNSMIEFKQIIGRGTRLYDGKTFYAMTLLEHTNTFLIPLGMVRHYPVRIAEKWYVHVRALVQIHLVKSAMNCLVYVKNRMKIPTKMWLCTL